MEIVTTEFLSSLIEQVKENGDSKTFEIDNSQEGYLRMLVSKYNKKNGKKYRARKISSVNWVISAPVEFIDSERWKRSFAIMQRVLYDPEAKITQEELSCVEADLGALLLACRKQTIEKKDTHDLLK